jgi:hypothetical protein
MELPLSGECGAPFRSKDETEVGHIYQEFIITTHHYIVLYQFNIS